MQPKPNSLENEEIRFTIRIPKVIYSKLVERKEKGGYKSISEVIREILRKEFGLIEKYKR